MYGLGAVALAVVTLIGARGGLPDHGMPRWPALTILAFDLLFFGVVGLVACHAGRPGLRLLRGPCFGYLGKISYGLYLYHMILLRLKMDLFDSPGGRDLAVDLLTLAATFGLAALSWQFVERPILAWKERFGYGTRNTEPRDDSTATRFDPAHRLPEAPEWAKTHRAWTAGEDARREDPDSRLL